MNVACSSNPAQTRKKMMTNRKGLINQQESIEGHTIEEELLTAARKFDSLSTEEQSTVREILRAASRIRNPIRRVIEEVEQLAAEGRTRNLLPEESRLIH
jgi:hypothetical protein